jgi:hypothetical protein
MQAPADWVFKMIAYETFKADYEDSYLALNREK